MAAQPAVAQSYVAGSEEGETARESIGLTLSNYKTAALLYDKIWYPFPGFIPEPIRFSGLGAAEFELALFNLEVLMWDPNYMNIDWNKTHPNHLRSLIQEPPSEDRLERISNAQKNLSVLEGALIGTFALNKNQKTVYYYLRYLRELIFQESKVFTIPIYNSVHKYENDFKTKVVHEEGCDSTLVLALNNLDIVDEKQLSWEQVTEFREDQEARLKYRRLLHWVDKEMLGRSQSFIEDEIHIRLEDYEKAIRKHGIKTAIGVLSDVIDGKFLIGPTAITTASILTGHPIIGAILSGGLMIGKVALSAAQHWIKYKETEPEGKRDIAYIYELKKKRSKEKKELKTKNKPLVDTQSTIDVLEKAIRSKVRIYSYGKDAEDDVVSILANSSHCKKLEGPCQECGEQTVFCCYDYVGSDPHSYYDNYCHVCINPDCSYGIHIERREIVGMEPPPQCPWCGRNPCR